MSFSNTLISIVIATHSRPKFLTEALACLARQTYRPLQVVIVDDGSSDATAEAVRAWKAQAKPDFEVLYKWQENQGPATARNKGVEISTGDHVLFLDDDDFFEPDTLAHLRHALQDEEVAIATASYRYWEQGQPQGPLVRPRYQRSGDVLSAMIQGAWFVPIHGYLFTRAALEKMGSWNPVLTSQEDDEFLLRAALAGIPFRPALEATVYYCQHDGVRRATPGKPGESVTKGLKKRMVADLAIRESVFETLSSQGRLDAYRIAFMFWHMRLRKRYGSILTDLNLSHPLLDWIETDIESDAETHDNAQT